MSDLDLLQTYEPVVRYTQGEMYFPTAVDGFVARCSLWTRGKNDAPRQLVPAGELTLARLAEYSEVPLAHSLYLRFVDQPLRAADYQRWRRRPERVPFRAGGRLARVPLLSRIADTLFDLSFLVRGAVPGGTDAAAEVRYRALCKEDDRRVYYGRVLREGGWIILHYLFFYAMNDWRSGFYGVNDHESDWEQIFIYLAVDETGTPTPRWAAYASHDFQGDDLRRRWDDPLLVKEGNHPVIFAGAGSHASYFERGEYVMGAEPKFLTPVKNVALTVRQLWVEKLGQGESEEDEAAIRQAVTVPFIDYARGDGLVIGPGGDEAWTPIVISDEDPWVDKYRGMWGLDVADPLGGERAPAGPKYNRDGSVRQAWYDPLGWAGLDKVTPPSDTGPALEARLVGLEAERVTVDAEVESKRDALRTLALDVEALRATDYFSGMHERKAREMERAEHELLALQARQTEIAETRVAVASYLRRVQRGDWGNPQAHIRHAHHPDPDPPPRSRIADLWAAFSAALALVAFILLFVLRPTYWWAWALATVVVFGVVEAATRGRLSNYLLSVVVVLAVVTTAILLWEYWELALVLLLIAVVVFIVRDNLRELRS
jgi:hypothetical protein